MKLVRIGLVLALSALCFQALADDLFGRIEVLPATGLIGAWRVAGQNVVVSAATRIKQEQGVVAVGACVEVKGAVTAGGTINATDIEVKPCSGSGSGSGSSGMEFYGIIQAMPQAGLVGQWAIGGRTVNVLATTQIKQERGRAQVGACAEVKAQAAGANLFTAGEIEIKSASDCGGQGSFHDEWFETNARVEQIPAGSLYGSWRIGGRTVVVLPTTELRMEGPPVGQCAEVKGQLLADGSIRAAKLEIGAFASGCGAPGSTSSGLIEVYGVLQSPPPAGMIGDWLVSGRRVHVLASTVVKLEHSAAVLGACVEVKGQTLADGSINATIIELESVSGTCFSSRGLVSSASFSSSGRVSPGEIVTIFGFSLGPSAAATLRLGDDRRVSSSLGGARVWFDDTPSPLLMASSNQINAVVPFSVSGRSETKVEIEFGGVRSNAQLLPVAESNPAIFTIDASGRGQGAILNQDSSVNSASNPAERGAVVVLFATGVGPANRKIEDGEVIGDDRTRVLLPIAVTIGGVNAEVIYAGGAPGLVAGVTQVNVRVPAEIAPAAAVPVILTAGNSSSQLGVTLAIR